MGCFSLCVENTARDVQSLLVLHKVHPKVCIDVRRRMDLLIEKSYEEMDVLEPGYGESSYDICHAMAKQIVKQTLEVGVPKSELAMAERRVAERDQAIFEWTKRAKQAEEELAHAHAVAAEMKNAHNFMLHTYFREVLVLRHQLDELKKKQAAAAGGAGAASSSASTAGSKLGFPRFPSRQQQQQMNSSLPPNTSPVTASGSGQAVVADGSSASGAGGGPDDSSDGSVSGVSPPRPLSGSTAVPQPPANLSGGLENSMEIGSGGPLANRGTGGSELSPTTESSMDVNNSSSRAVTRRVSLQTSTRGVTTAGNRGRAVSNSVVMNIMPPTNAIFDYQEYIKMLKVSQIDYEARYKALLAERGEMLKRHREARVKSMMDNKATLEESKFMIEELTKQLEAARAMSLMSEYKLRMCTEPVKEELNAMLNEIRMEVTHMQEEHDVDLQRMKAAVTEAQDRSDALLDFVLTYIQAIAQLVVVVYEDASAKSNDSLQNDPFTEIGYVLPSFFTVTESERRVKPMVKLEEAARGRKALAPGSRPSSQRMDENGGVSSSGAKGSGKRGGGSRSGRKSKVLIQDAENGQTGGGGESGGAQQAGSSEEDKNIVFITEPGQLYDATATRFWSEHPVSRNAQRVLSEFQALAMQLRARKEILLRQKDLLSRGGGKNATEAGDGKSEKSGRKGRLGDGKHQKPPGTLGGGAGITKVLEVDEADILEINDDFEATNPEGLSGMLSRLGIGGGGDATGVPRRDHPHGTTPPPRAQQNFPRQQQQQRQQHHQQQQQHQQQLSPAGKRRPHDREEEEGRPGERRSEREEPQRKKKAPPPPPPSGASGGKDGGGVRNDDTVFSLSVEDDEATFDEDFDDERADTDSNRRASEENQFGKESGSSTSSKQERGKNGRQGKRGVTKRSLYSDSGKHANTELARIDTSGMNVLLKQQVELLQTHIQQLQEQLQLQHDLLLKYHRHQRHLQSSQLHRGKSREDGAGKSFSSTQDMESSISSTSFFAPSTPRPPQLHYVPTSAHGGGAKPLTQQAYQALLRLNKSGKSAGRLGGEASPQSVMSSSTTSSARGMSPPPPSDSGGDSGTAGLGVDGHSLDTGRPKKAEEGYHKMLLMAIENNKRREKAKEREEEQAAAAAAHQIHPYFLQDPPEGWRCPYCDGYFTMEQAEKALADHPAPVTTYQRRLKEGWLDRPILKCKDFDCGRHLITELRRLRYRRVVYRARWSVARQFAGPIVLVASAKEDVLQLPPVLSREATAQRQCQRYEKVMNRLSKRISKMLLWLKYHIVNETEEVKTISHPGKPTDIMDCIQEKRTRRAMFRSPYLIAPIEHHRPARSDEDEEEEEKEWDAEDHAEDIDGETGERGRWSSQQQQQQQPVRYIMELGGRKMEINSYWTETLREEAKKREEANAAERAHQRALKKRGMFQSPYGAVSGFCLGVQQGLPAKEAHRGPVHLDFDYEKDRYFVSNEYGHAALEHPHTKDKEADAAGPPSSTVAHPSEAPSRAPFTMTQILVPAPLAMLPAPFNELAFEHQGSKGTTVSDGFILFSDPSTVPGGGGGQSKKAPRPTSSPGPREASRQKELLQPVYMVPMTIPVEPQEFAYHGYGRTRDAEVYDLHKSQKRRRGGGSQRRAGTASSAGGSSDDDSSRPGSQQGGRLSHGAAEDYRSDGAHPSSFSRPPPPLPPLPPSLQSTAYGILMKQDPQGRIVGTYMTPQPLATYAAIQQPPRVARPRNEEQQMFRIHAVGGGGTGGSEGDDQTLSPRQKVVSALQQAKQQRAARLAEQERAEAERRAQRQEEWESRHEIVEPIPKEKFLRLRLPTVAGSVGTSSRESGGLGALPDPNTSVRCQRKLATKDRLGANTIAKPKLGGGGPSASVAPQPSVTTTAAAAQEESVPLRQPSAPGPQGQKKQNAEREYPAQPSVRIPPLVLDNQEKPSREAA